MRCTVRWVKFGGENTKFFHAKATERYRNNIIREIKDDEGIIRTEHHENASAFLHSFKGRMGISIPTLTHFDLSTLLSHVFGLDFFSCPFH
jgi:hypothetical protein